jgi:hypothetical protein
MKELTEQEKEWLKLVNDYINTHNTKEDVKLKQSAFLIIRSGERRKRFTVWYHDAWITRKGVMFPSRYDKFHVGYCNYENMLDLIKSCVRRKATLGILKIKLEVGTLDVDMVASSGSVLNSSDLVVPFGKYKGMTLGNIKDIDKKYFYWLMDCAWASLQERDDVLEKYTQQIKDFFNKMARILQKEKKMKKVIIKPKTNNPQNL